jgi:hypothetical protein
MEPINKPKPSISPALKSDLPNPKSEGIQSNGIRNLLSKRVSEFHPDTSTTIKCLGAISFSDRPLDEREKITVLAICRCYAKDRRQRTMFGYVGFLKGEKSDAIDLTEDLYKFRTDPTSVRDVNKYAIWVAGRINGITK